MFEFIVLGVSISLREILIHVIIDLIICVPICLTVCKRACRINKHRREK